jgi:uncharacterized protein (DUF2236 family)
MRPRTPRSDRVDRGGIEESFNRLRAQIPDPGHGVFGPRSMMWRLASPVPVLPLTLMEAGLLEAPHPIIAYGTMGSKSATEFMPRFHRSADAFYDWFYGDLDTAMRTARRIFGYHSKIQGELPEDIGGYHEGRPYEANEQEVLIWVWATIIRPLKEYYEHLHGPLRPAEIDQYFDECRRFAMLFGIDQGALPKDWRAFQGYFDGFAASPTIELSSEYLNRPGPLSGQMTGSRGARMATGAVNALLAYRLPPHVLAQYPHLSRSRRRRRVVIAVLAVLRVLWPRLPRGLRESPRYRSAVNRIGPDSRPSPLARWVARKLPPPYGKSYLAAGLSSHGASLRRQRG